MNDLNKHKEPPNILYEQCVKERLDDNLYNYCHELDNSISYLSHRKNETILKKVSSKL